MTNTDADRFRVLQRRIRLYYPSQFCADAQEILLPNLWCNPSVINSCSIFAKIIGMSDGNATPQVPGTLTFEPRRSNTPEPKILDDVIVIKHYLQNLEECHGMTCKQADLLEHKKRVFTNAIAYATYIYPNIVRFLDHVQVLMKQIVDGELEGVAEECEERRMEGQNLQTDGSIFAASRLVTLSRNLRELQARLKKEADKLQKEMWFLDKLTGKIASKRIEVSDLKADMESAGKLHECCLELRNVFWTIDALVEVVVKEVGVIRDDLGFATEARKDKDSQAEIILYKVKDEAAKLLGLPILKDMLDSNVQTISSLQTIADRGGLEETELCDWCDCFAKHRSNKTRHITDGPQPAV